jgi:NADPH-dependent curcumin reductase CurA
MGTSRKNQHYLLASRPRGELADNNFRLVDVEMPSPGEGEVLIETRYLALEPAMKGWMEARGPD